MSTGERSLTRRGFLGGSVAVAAGAFGAHAAPDATVPMVQQAEDFIVVVIGGAGKHSAYMPTFGSTHAVSRAVALRDGTPVASAAEFKRS